MQITNRQIQKSIVCRCSLDTAWQKWTTHEGLKSFFGKDNKIELAPGGAFEIYFLTDLPYGLQGSEGCKVLSFIPGQMFSFTWNAPPDHKEARESGYHTWVVINFKEITQKQTQVELVHLGWPGGKIWEDVFNYFDKAWDTVLAGLNKSMMHD